MGNRITGARVRRAGAAVALGALLAGCGPWQIALVSTNAAGTDSADSASLLPDISPDGTKVVFESWADNLGPTDTNHTTDVYLRDLTTGRTTLVSANPAGVAGDGESQLGWFSPDGTKVVFDSSAKDLTPVPAPNMGLYVRDLASGTTTLVSGDHATSGAGGFSPDGTKIVWGEQWSSGQNPGVFETDLATGTITRLAQGRWPTYAPTGHTVAYVDGDQVWILDVATGAVTQASAGAPGRTAFGLAFSSDGRRLAFTRQGTSTEDIYVYDLVAKTTKLVTAARTGGGGATGTGTTGTTLIGFAPGDGNRVLFYSRAGNLVAGDTNGVEDVFVRNIANSTTRLVSQTPSGTAGRAASTMAKWLGPSRVAFVSLAGDLGPTDQNTAYDVYVRDLVAGTTTLVSANAAGTGSGAGQSGGFDWPAAGLSTIFELSTSRDGTKIAFGSEASDLGPVDTPRSGDQPIRHDIYVATFVPPPA